MLDGIIRGYRLCEGVRLRIGNGQSHEYNISPAKGRFPVDPMPAGNTKTGAECRR